jgi:peroxiredoxin
LDGFSEIRQELDDKNIKVVAASADPQDKAAETATHNGFPIGYGADLALAERIGGYWEARREIVQPSTFVLTPDNTIAQLCYSDGPLGRILAEDVIRFVNFQESQKKS